MSFSILAREIRDLIYHALLCPPAGIQLELGHERWSREDDYAYEDLDEEEDIDEEEEEEEVGDFDQRGISNLIPSAVTPIPTAIFHVNCQIR